MEKGDKFIRTYPAEYYTVTGKPTYEELPKHVKAGYKSVIRNIEFGIITDENGFFHLLKNVIKL